MRYFFLAIHKVCLRDSAFFRRKISGRILAANLCGIDLFLFLYCFILVFLLGGFLLLLLGLGMKGIAAGKNGQRDAAHHHHSDEYHQGLSCAAGGNLNGENTHQGSHRVEDQHALALIEAGVDETMVNMAPIRMHRGDMVAQPADAAKQMSNSGTPSTRIGTTKEITA